MSLLIPLLAAQEVKEKDKDEPPANFAIEQWLRGPDRQDFKWRVEITSPRLTFQQRTLVQVHAYLDVPATQGDNHPDLFFLLKVADESGKWLEDGSHNHYPLPPGLTKKNEIQYSAGLYAKPGKYTAALVLYDASSGRGNVWHKPFEVRAPKSDALSGMERDIPAIEFISEVPNAALPSEATAFPVRGGRRGPFGMGDRGGISGFSVINDVSDEEWPPGHGMEVLPVRVSRPLRVDVILNLAPHVDPDLQRRNRAEQYRAAAGSMLQIGALLSHLDVEPGCVRVSAIDLSKLLVVFDDIDGRTADWDKLTEQVRKLDHNTISVELLKNKNATPDFLRDYLSKVFGESGCSPGSEKTNRAVVVVSHDFQFPSGAHADNGPGEGGCVCRLIHLRIGSAGQDDLDKFLKTADPKRIDARTPEQFRRALEQVIEELNGGRERER